jgi:hypothetical protein
MQQAYARTATAAPQGLIQDGYHVIPGGVDAGAAGRLLAKLKATRGFDETLFLSEAEFDAAPQYTGVNPRPGRNLLERFDADLAFVEQAPSVKAVIEDLLGPGFKTLDRKVVCGVPDRAMPAWLKAGIAGNPVNNLGAYVRPEYRDVTYFYGIDFHQDLIDHKNRPADFITLYIYLHPVTANDAPLYILPGSHALGGSIFPHDLTRTPDGGWLYRDGRGREVQTRLKMLTGPAGYVALWHACMLHGTQPDAADHERISLRYLLARQDGGEAGIDQVNAAIKGPLSLEATRIDLSAQGQAILKQNTVNQA